jgi:hypothetical protein
MDIIIAPIASLLVIFLEICMVVYMGHDNPKTKENK